MNSLVVMTPFQILLFTPIVGVVYLACFMNGVIQYMCSIFSLHSTVSVISTNQFIVYIDNCFLCELRPHTKNTLTSKFDIGHFPPVGGSNYFRALRLCTWKKKQPKTIIRPSKLTVCQLFDTMLIIWYFRVATFNILPIKKCHH